MASNKCKYWTCRKPGLPWAPGVRQPNSSPQQKQKESRCDCVSHGCSQLCCKHCVPPSKPGLPALHQGALVLLGKAAVTAVVVLRRAQHLQLLL